MARKTLLILDLDETLIHATAEKIRDDFDFQVYQYFVYKRPGLTKFLTQCADHFTLAVWSSANDDYVQAVVDQIFPSDVLPAFIWGRSRCTRFIVPEQDEEGFYSTDYSQKYEFAKRLKKAARQGYDLKRTLIVDDTPEKVTKNYGNAIYIKPYLGGLVDNELPALTDYLTSLVNLRDGR